jgi:hypothetical protein
VRKTGVLVAQAGLYVLELLVGVASSSSAKQAGPASGCSHSSPSKHSKPTLDRNNRYFIRRPMPASTPEVVVKEDDQAASTNKTIVRGWEVTTVPTAQALPPAPLPREEEQQQQQQQQQQEEHTTSPAMLVKHDGPVVCLNRGEAPFPEEGFDFFASIQGLETARHFLGQNKETYGERWLREVRARFHEREAEAEWDAFLGNGGTCGGRRLYWAVMQLPPGRSFPLHAHPCLEVIHIIRGRLHERRMLGPPLSLVEEEGKLVREMAPVDLSRAMPPPQFRDGVFVEDSVNVNEMGSVHQSWTDGEEGCLLMCIWGGGHCNIEGERLPEGFRMGGCCGVTMVEER